MKNKIIPRGKYVLVKTAGKEALQNEFGLLVPANEERESKAQGEVVAVSKQVADIKKGNQVIYGQFAGEQLKVKESGKEVEYKLLHEEDIIAFIG